MPIETMLTTVDNPFNPFTQWDEWLAYDERKKHFTCSYLARIVKSSDELSQADEDLAIQSAIDEIVNDGTNVKYRKVSIEVNDIKE